jgi:anti-anti-sigma factor
MTDEPTSVADATFCVQIEDRGRALAAHLKGVVDASVAEELRQATLGLAESGKNVVIELGEVERLHASSLQLLLALRRELVGHGRSFSVIGRASRIDEYLALAGASELLAGSADAVEPVS